MDSSSPMSPSFEAEVSRESIVKKVIKVALGAAVCGVCLYTGFLLGSGPASVDPLFVSPAHANSASTTSLFAKAPRSKAVPVLQQPSWLDGTLPGDAGFDPLGIAKDRDLKYLRNSEVKHARLAMMTAIAPGSPITKIIQEFSTRPGAATAAKKAAIPILGYDWGQVDDVGVFYWGAVFAAQAYADAQGEDIQDKEGALLGDMGVDFAKLLGNKTPEQIFDLQTKELKNGRLAMMALIGAAVQYGLTHPFDSQVAGAVAKVLEASSTATV